MKKTKRTTIHPKNLPKKTPSVNTKEIVLRNLGTPRSSSKTENSISSGRKAKLTVRMKLSGKTASTDTEKTCLPKLSGKTASTDTEKTCLPVHVQPTYLQQDDFAKQFFLDIGNDGLRYAWAKYFLKVQNPKEFARTKTNSPKHIIIVGGGFAGLSAAFELEQVGHRTTILELQYRVGGRAKTIYHGLSEGLHAEGGAMRLPLKEHFLVNHYINSLKVPIRIFQNENETGRTILNLFGQNIKKQDWIESNLKYLSRFYPKAAEFVKDHGMTNIDQLYQRTIEPVIMDLQKNTSPDGWRRWVERWSKYSVESFLLEEKELNDEGLRPWPVDAIQAYKVTNYSPLINRSLVEVLREDVGKWWSDTLWTPKDGMQSFAERFTEKSLGWNKDIFLSKNIQFGKRVEILKINNDRVFVRGRNTFTGLEFEMEGDSVIVTTTLPILRQMTIQDETDKKNFLKIQKVISDVHYEASTKILLQCRSRFWEKDLGNGGFSKTNQPIGQIHYPSNDDRVPNTQRAILVCYTWGQDAIMLGSQPEQEAVASAVRQIKSIHPQIEEEFEVGKVQAWTRDESAQLAFTYLNPNQYQYALETLLMTDTHPLHIAGEALSWTHGWIQGALESGLRAAYNIFCKYEKQRSK